MASRLKSTIREAVAQTLLKSGAMAAVRAASRSVEHSRNGWCRTSAAKNVILCYHRIGLEGVPIYSRMRPGDFEEQMKYVAQHYKVVPLSELLSGDSDEPQRIAITFDDGYRDLFQFAFPVLRRYQLPATIYLAVSPIENNDVAWYDKLLWAITHTGATALETDLLEPTRVELGKFDERLRIATTIVQRLRKMPDSERNRHYLSLMKYAPASEDACRDRMLTWDQIREMQKHSISFGAHTMTHRVSAQISENDFRSEVEQSKKIIEQRLQTEVADFAYPFGQPWDCRSDGGPILRSLSIRSATTTSWGVNGAATDPYRLTRVQLGDEPSLSSFALNLARTFMMPISDGAPVDPVVSSSYAEVAR